MRNAKSAGNGHTGKGRMPFVSRCSLRSPREREYGVVGRDALIDSPLLCFQGASVRPTFTLHVYVIYARSTYFYLYLNHTFNSSVLYTLRVRDALCMQAHLTDDTFDPAALRARFKA